jgi:hypothetical protein
MMSLCRESIFLTLEQRGLNTTVRGPRSSSFWVSQNLSHHMDRQASIGDTVFVKSREMTGRTQTVPW